MWLLIQHQPSAESKYARELCRPREPGNQRTLHHSFPRPLTPSPRHRTARSGRGGRHPRAPLVWSFALQGEGRRPVSGSRLAPTPGCGASLRDAPKGKNSRYYRTTRRHWAGCASGYSLSRLPPHLTPHALSGQRAPGNGRRRAAALPSLLAAFRSLPRLPLLLGEAVIRGGGGREGEAPRRTLNRSPSHSSPLGRRRARVRLQLCAAGIRR